jgi:hypothetical protein
MDQLTLVARTRSKTSVPAVLLIKILPVNDETPKLVRFLLSEALSIRHFVTHPPPKKRSLEKYTRKCMYLQMYVGFQKLLKIITYIINPSQCKLIFEN